MKAPRTEVFLAPKLRDLFFRPGPRGEAIYCPSRYKIAHGGRSSGKSWGFAAAAVLIGTLKPWRFLCVRETQSSIRDSIYQLIVDQIERLGLGAYYEIQRDEIRGVGTDTRFLFAGIRTDPDKIKSMERIDVCLVEEAHKVTENSWSQLINTVRNVKGRRSEMWVCFNPRLVTDPTSVRFIERTPPDCRRVQVNFSDNPWFPEDMELERRYALQLISEAREDGERSQLQADYDHVWLGAYQRRSDSAVIRRWVEDEFDDPPASAQTHFLYGADWGFAADPTALVRFWIADGELWVSHEAYGTRVELDDTPRLFDTVPGARQWLIKADGARPETISHLKGKGFKIEAAAKWQGSVEDGIAYLNAFRRIHIHKRCTNLLREARLYQYKTVEVGTVEQVLPIIVDKYNHGWDAVRYGLDGFITRPAGGFFKFDGLR